MNDYLNTPIEFLKGVGPKRGELFRKEINVFSFEDLLNYLPFRYVDKSSYVKISEICRGGASSAHVLVQGKILSKEVVGTKFKSRLVVRFADETGEIDLIWFKGVKWINENLKIGENYVIFGKPALFNKSYNFTHPEIDLASETKLQKEGLYPMYNTTETMKNRGITSKAISKLMQTLLEGMAFVIPEILPPLVLEKYPLISRDSALRLIHFPKNQDELARAQNRIKFEELFLLQMRVLKQKSQHQLEKSYVFSKVGENFNHFFKENLPFTLTDAQKRVVKEIRKDLGSGFQMNRLLQGDVGSGKTLVALMAMLIASDNGFQSCLMAPTEILAQQHFKSIQKFLTGLDIGVGLLTGSTKTKERRELHEGLQNGTIKILIGTHALIEDAVQFQKLGLCVIDEQHRFGVAQRSKLWAKSQFPPHILVMTATPIPRTLAMTLYGDLDTSVIDELPPNRKPVQTLHRYDNSRLKLYEFLKQELRKGRQIYVVYPLIKESEKLDLKDLEEGYFTMCSEFPRPEFQVSILHGKMPQTEKDLGMKLFVENKTQIMVSTTVIEVGVDVPNATVMVIENAERFGLSQLHQLRGRVGRGAEQSYCILMSSHKLSNEAKKRLDTMVKTNDGFKIAEADLQLRGPGDIQGTQQSGALNFKLADLTKDERIIRAARIAAGLVLDEDPNLSQLQHQKLNITLRKMYGDTVWSKIS
ncbi:MAG: ATP-dependent DNA helicase RecG [Bacteroidales bacterium]|nr:ATP-dependent DNA helicase RecG [Bacteroidales bacterium]